MSDATPIQGQFKSRLYGDHVRYWVVIEHEGSVSELPVAMVHRALLQDEQTIQRVLGLIQALASGGELEACDDGVRWRLSDA